MEFAQRILTAETVADRTVLEVGSRVVNGSVRPFVTGLNPASYTGIDATVGPGVDMVMDCTLLSTHVGRTWDVVVSTEMLEHAADWRGAMLEMAKAVVPGGLLVVTTRSPGMPYHTPPDHWRFTTDDMADILAALDLSVVALEDDTDPGRPGVLAAARKPLGVWTPTKLDSIEVAPSDRFKKRTRANGQTAANPRVGHNGNGARPQEGKQLVVAFPLYKSVPVSWLFQWLTMDKGHVVGTVGTEAIYLPMAMDQLVAMAFESCPDFDWLVVYEHDMIPPTDAFERIAQYGDEYDIVGTVYFKHDWPHHVMAWGQVEPPYYSPLTAETIKVMVDNPALYDVDAVAMGFTSIRREVFERWDRSIPMWDPTPPLVGHDLHFCNEAKKQGFRVSLDSGIGSGHLTQIAIGYPDSQEALAEANPPRWTPGGVPELVQ